MNVVTRIAPSPTGRMHIGTARSALFNYLWAKHTGGKFIIRIEDTDRERDKREYEKDILENLTWLGITADEFYRQSDNRAKHAEAIAKLIENGYAYVSKEPAKDNPEKEVEIIRFKNPKRPVTFSDVLRGEITVDVSDLGDFVIARSMTEPVHHLAVVVDDADEGVTLAMRGEDLLSNTPRQILIQEALGLPRPAYLHLPLILAPDRTKLSKRRHAVSTGNYREEGYLPQGLNNFLAFLGWHPGTDQEILNTKELIENFSLDQIQKSSAIFDETKLKWFNREHILRLSPEDFLTYAEKFLSPETLRSLKKEGLLEKLVPIMRERIQTFGELRDMDAAGEFNFFMKAPEYAKEHLLWKKEPSKKKTAERLQRSLTLLELIPNSDWNDKKIKDILWPYAESEGRGEVLWPLRYALSGREKSPDPFLIAGMIGKDETLARIKTAIEALA